ncbi:hypothetical protein QJQ45_007201 [Haematococcus lacustris]|nr:hypothetical protein QJQ45_007201 [Haematococcus lacustris]
MAPAIATPALLLATPPLHPPPSTAEMPATQATAHPNDTGPTNCDVALGIGESRWRPLELCYWPDQTALPTKGKEYPGLGYKRLRDKPPKAQQQQQQQQQPAVAQ